MGPLYYGTSDKGIHMRLVKKPEFLSLPEGTLFAPMQQQWVFGDLSIKGESLPPDDFWEIPFGWPDDAFEGGRCKLDEMMADSSVSYPANDTIQREGLYDPHSVYLVYEKNDVDRLIGRLKEGYDT